MARGHSKGSSFERKICKELSLWWTKGKRDDVFWRTAGSGARAKTRSKTNKDTFGQHGDIQATDPIGQPLIDVCTIEIKRGYNSISLQDLLDLPDPTKKTKAHSMTGFLRQAFADHCNSNSSSWMLIVCRDRRKALVIVSRELYLLLMRNGFSTFNAGRPMIHIKAKPFQDGMSPNITAITLDQFFLHVPPEAFRALV